MPTCSTFGNWSHLYTVKFGLPSYCTIGWHLRRWFSLSNSDLSTNIWPDFSSLGPYAMPTYSTLGNWSHLYTVKVGLPSYCTGLWALQFFWSAIHTPIHQIFWSAIRTPIHNYFWSADWCTPNSTPLHKLDWSANWSAALYSSLQSILPSALQSNFHSKI